MDILFLDDNEERWQTFKRAIVFGRRNEDQNITWVTTAEECIEALRSTEFQEIWLDHDLGNEVYVDTMREDCGMEVVRWIREHGVKGNPKFVVHSLNFPASEAMAKSLRYLCYDVCRVPFRIKGS